MSLHDDAPTDTSPEVDRLYRSQLMRRSGADRLHMGAAMFDATRAMVEAHVRARATSQSESDVRLSVFARIYATDLDEHTRAEVVERIRRSQLARAEGPPHRHGTDTRAQHKRWLENWKRVGPLLEAERWERVRNMTDEEALTEMWQLLELWQPDWPTDEGEELLLHQRVFARARRRS